MSVKTIASLIVVLFFVGIGVFIGWHIKPEPTLDQLEPIDEATESPAIIETLYVETPAKIITKHITKTDTVLVNKDTKPTTEIVTPPFIPPHLAEQITAFHPFYFSREGASFQMDITYRYYDQKFRFENMTFVAPKQKVVYRESLFKFGSAMGLLTDTNGNTKLLLQPVNFSLWKINFYPTLMIDPEYQISYGGLVGFRW